MPLIVIFILGAVVIGAGAMLSPAWQTAQPRIGLLAALSLGLVMGGAVFWAMLFGWDTLVVDYLLFALVTAIFLLGTLSFGQKRAEARGEELADKDQGWLSGRDLLFFAASALIFIVPAVVLPVPLDTDAQGFGYLALMARLGGGFDTLAPFQPEVSYLYAPGFSALAAYLSQQLGQGMHTIQIGIGAVLSLVLVILAYDFGAELGSNPLNPQPSDKRLGRAMAAALLIGAGVFTAYMDSHFTTLLALVFAFAFLIFMFRYLRDGTPADVVASGLMLGATVLSHPDTTIILGLGFVPFLFTIWLSKPRPSMRRMAVLIGGMLAVALIGIAPWLINVRDLLGADIVSPFERDPRYWRLMLVHHAPVIPFVVIGAVVGLRRRAASAILSVGWLIFALDFSTLGISERLLGGFIAPVLRYDYPMSIAWHAPILPYTILGGIGVLWVYERIERAIPRLNDGLHRAAPALFVALGVIALVIGVSSENVLALTRGRLRFYGAFSSHADVRAMTWIKENAPQDARILNHPAPHEADWVAVISERESVYFRPQPFFRGTDAIEAEQTRLRAFWENPADADNAALLDEYGIDYVIVPQVVGNPASFERMFRWRAPFTESVVMQSAVGGAPYLTLVYDDDGAQVYQVQD